MNVRELLDKTAPWLAGKGLASARLEAELLLAHVLKVSRLKLYTGLDRPVGEGELEDYRALVRRRARGEPSAYLTGAKEFYGLAMAVGPSVLIPRPETELLVDRARELQPARILDLCTGCGCVAVASAMRLPGAQVVAVDLSGAALEVAAANAARHGVADRIRFLCGDLFAPLKGEPAFDLILANPPYVATGQAAGPAAHEPHLALFAGPEGTDVIARILREAPPHLAPGAPLVMEIGEEQEQQVLALAAPYYRGAGVRRDLAGLPRVFEGTPALTGA
ncbi:MAG: peptide chain release factor N(5)-glutamine methyltransferase [Planctomycetaceae bacterium]